MYGLRKVLSQWLSSFNPCFRGTCSWWKLSDVCERTQRGFQSLFSWNLLLMLDVVQGPAASIGFQSLFSWNLLLMSRWNQPPKTRISSFNPCFRGTCSWCELETAIRAAVSVFQSLFSWNLLLMSNWHCKKTRHYKFQSLFSWNLLLMSIGSICSWAYVLFQSLFSWNLLLMWKLISGPARCWMVSILVFVELALDGNDRLYTWGWHRVSILVFVELALDDRIHFIHVCNDSLFQSLFSWNLLLMVSRFIWMRFGLDVSILVFVELALDGIPMLTACW